MESVVQRDSAVYTYFSDTLLIDGTSTIAAICRSTLFPNSEFYNRDKSSIFSRKKNALRPRRNEKRIYIRACIRTSITPRVKTAQLRGCTSVSSGSLHACMMNSLRRLLLSEVTGHKVMTATVLRIPRFYSTLFAQFSHASISVSFVLYASLSSSSIALAATAYCYIREIARIPYGFFRFSFRVSSVFYS